MTSGVIMLLTSDSDFVNTSGTPETETKCDTLPCVVNQVVNTGNKMFLLSEENANLTAQQYDSRNIIPFCLDFTEHCECLTVDHGALSVWASGDFRFLSLVLLKTQSVICTS